VIHHYSGIILLDEGKFITGNPAAIVTSGESCHQDSKQNK
jgi:hypothetical protein